MGVLAAVGLDEVEERLYEELADRGGATADQLAGAVGLSSCRASSILDTLVDRYLATRVADQPARYVVSPPDQAIDSLARGVEEAVSRARAHAAVLAKRARAAESRHQTELVEVLEGDAIAARINQVERAARQQIRLFDLPPWLSDCGENPIEPAQLASGVNYRVVYDRALLDNPRHVERIRRCIRGGEHARTFSHLPLKLMVVDDDAALVPLMAAPNTEPPAVLLVRPSVLLDTMVVIFEALWNRAVPLRAGFSAEDVGDIDPSLSEILGLLAAGMKDEVIARILGITVRTVRRRVRWALDTLGVDTRFQAGIRAAELGLVGASEKAS
jgi:DNA-binding CsgD family transcriptional regulator